MVGEGAKLQDPWKVHTIQTNEDEVWTNDGSVDLSLVITVDGLSLGLSHCALL
jgi:hypothetical protein